MPPSPGWLAYWSGLLLVRAQGRRDRDLGERLARARRYLEQHADQPLDLSVIAGSVHYSKFHFLRSFRDAYGQTPVRYLTEVRLARARQLLETTDDSVTEICWAVGYESLPSFCSAFRRLTGVSPERYRRRWVTVSALSRLARVPACVLAMYGPSPQPPSA
jgi:AraC-like DNA-binding protein